jgi:hypothetical protein
VTTMLPSKISRLEHGLRRHIKRRTNFDCDCRLRRGAIGCYSMLKARACSSIVSCTAKKHMIKAALHRDRRQAPRGNAFAGRPRRHAGSSCGDRGAREVREWKALFDRRSETRAGYLSSSDPMASPVMEALR